MLLPVGISARSHHGAERAARELGSLLRQRRACSWDQDGLDVAAGTPAGPSVRRRNVEDNKHCQEDQQLSWGTRPNT